MAIKIEECRDFITQSDRYGREQWLVVARASWRECKARTMDNKLWSTELAITGGSVFRARYPLWNNIYKVRQNLVLSRAGVPIGRDTTQDGRDKIGATAAMLRERLAINIPKTFDFFDVMCAARDDMLITNFGLSRAYYEAEEVKEEVKERLTVQPSEEEGVDPIFLDGSGKVVVSDDIHQDEEGFYLETEKTVDVKNEKVCLEPCLYSEVYIDPDIRRWNRCKRLALASYYSEPEFRKIFGLNALLDLQAAYQRNGIEASNEKRQRIKVYEYWDKYENKVLWFADDGTDFIQPTKFYLPEEAAEEEEAETINGLYDLDGFFPCPNPLIINQPTDEFWPVPEYYQLVTVLNDVHNIFGKMVTTTQAIRIRLLFDNNVAELQRALNEANAGDAYGVANLQQLISQQGGSLDGLMQYIPIGPAIESLNQLSQALEQRLNMVYRLTGTSDMLQGLATDGTQRTFGERQMTEKYALNQLEEMQRKMQEYVCNSLQVLTEIAIKNFSDKSLEEYIMPSTLPPDHQQNYQAALELLKNNHKRFRIELETDSTIAINEEYDKQHRIEFVKALTESLQQTAQIAEQSPELLVPTLQAMKFLIQGFRQAKMFQQELTESIDNVIKKTQEQQQAAANEPPPFDKDKESIMVQREELDLKREEIQANNALKQYQRQAENQMEVMKLQQEAALAQMQAQLDGFKQASENSKTQAELQFKYQQLEADFQKAQQEIASKNESLMIELQKVSDKKEYENIKLGLEAHIANSELQLAEMQTQLEAASRQSEDKERWATEARLADEHKIKSLNYQLDAALAIKELRAPPELPKIAPKKTKKKVKIKRDENGDIQDFEIDQQEG